MGWFQDQMDEVSSGLGNLPESETIFPESRTLLDPWHYRNQNNSDFQRAIEKIRQQISYTPIPGASSDSGRSLSGIFLPEAHAATTPVGTAISNIAGSSFRDNSNQVTSTVAPSRQFIG